MSNNQDPTIGPDGKEWAKTKAGYAHVDAVLARADGETRAPYWHGWALREAFVAGAEWQERRGLSAICRFLQAAPQPAVLIDERSAFEMAYAKEWAKARGFGTPEELAAEIKQWRDGDTYPEDLPRLRIGWECFKWRADLASQRLQERDPALPTRHQVADALLAEVSGNFTREDDLPNELLRRIDAYLTSEGYTE
jgi:hypothetical protein